MEECNPASTPITKELLGAPTGMKFIDLREGWVMDLRDRKKCQVLKVDTTLNPADFGTKILTVKEFRRQRKYYLDTPKFSRAKIKRKGGLESLDKIELNNEHPAALEGVEQGLACMAMLGGH